MGAARVFRTRPRELGPRSRCGPLKPAAASPSRSTGLEAAALAVQAFRESQFAESLAARHVSMSRSAPRRRVTSSRSARCCGGREPHLSIAWRVEPLEQRWPRLSPVDIAVVLLRGERRSRIVTLSVLSALVSGSAEQLVGKLVDRCATNSTPDTRHDGGSVSVQRRVAFRASGEE